MHDAPAAEPESPPPHAPSEPHAPPPTEPARSSPLALLFVLGLSAAALAGGQMLYRRATAQTAAAPLASLPRPVTVVRSTAGRWQDDRRYIGTLEPWLSAHVGPELVSAYLRAVLVRPGDAVHDGQLLASLDCRNVATVVRANAAQLRALRVTEQAHASLTQRYRNLAPQGFVSANEVEQQSSLTAADQARAQAVQAQLEGGRVAVDDCQLRAPFNGEVGLRHMDPGAYARPGSPVLTVLDRTTVRVTAEVPENDFAMVAPESPVELNLVATGTRVQGRISRRSPSADAATRTIHVEVDLPNADRALPVNTTGELRVPVGTPRNAMLIPLTGAQVRGQSARLFVVQDGVARQRSVRVLGERQGTLYLDPELGEGAQVVTEGRALLSDGDRVEATEARPTAPAPSSAPRSDGGAAR